jgi:hypothetical protein
MPNFNIAALVKVDVIDSPDFDDAAASINASLDRASVQLDDGVTVTFGDPIVWHNDHGPCYECGLPAAFAVPDAYGRRDAEEPFTAKHKRCAVCAANDAVDGERIIRLDGE